MLSPFLESNHLERVTVAELFGTSADAPVTRADAMALPAIARARKLICGQVARLTWSAYRGKDRIDPSPSILSQPESGRARVLTMAWTTDALMFFGRAWWLVKRRAAEDNRPTDFEWIPEYAVRFDPVSGRIVVNDKPLDNPADLIRIDAQDEGLLTYAADPLRAARALHQASARASANPVPLINLHQVSGEPMTTPQIRQLTADWIAARNSSTGAVGFTNSAIEAKPMGTPVEQLLIAGRDAAALEAAQMLNLPAWALDAKMTGSSLTYSNVPSRTRELVEYTLTPYLDAIAGRLSMDDVLARGTWCKPDTEGLTTPDFKDRMEGYKAAQDANVYTSEECRELELYGRVQTPATEQTGE